MREGPASPGPQKHPREVRGDLALKDEQELVRERREESGAEAIRDREGLCASRGDVEARLGMSREGAGLRAVCLGHQQRNRPFPRPAQWRGPRPQEWAVVWDHAAPLVRELPGHFPLSRGRAAPRALSGVEEAAGPHALSTDDSQWSPGGGPGLPSAVRRKGRPWNVLTSASCKAQELIRILSSTKALLKATVGAAQRWEGHTGVSTSLRMVPRRASVLP